MKKEDAVEQLDRAGHMITDLNAKVWNTALNPTEFGWGSSVASIVAIPVLSAASIGQLVSAAVVRQISPSVFDTLSNLSPGKDGGGGKSG